MIKGGKIFKTIVGACIILSAFTACESQMKDLNPTRASSMTGSQAADSIIFVDDEQPASFPGGMEALLAFLDQNVRYPDGYDGCGQGLHSFFQCSFRPFILLVVMFLIIGE